MRTTILTSRVAQSIGAHPKCFFKCTNMESSIKRLNKITEKVFNGYTSEYCDQNYQLIKKMEGEVKAKKYRFDATT